jgi:hypothetical protein
MNVQVERTRPISERDTNLSGAELVTEVSDLATGAGILLFVAAPFALPALALMAVVMAAVAVAVIILGLVGVVLVAPMLLVRQSRRSRDRSIAAGARRDDHRSPRHVEHERRARHGVAWRRSELARPASGSFRGPRSWPR